MKNKVLITGGAGFIGSSLALQLINSGYCVVVMDNLSEQIHTKNFEDSYSYQLIKGKVEFHRGDVRNIDDWRKVIHEVEVVVHLAAETGTGQSMYHSQNYTKVNCEGTAILCDLLTEGNHRISKVVLASSRSIYGEGKYVSNDGTIFFPSQRDEEKLSNGDFEFYNNGEKLKAIATDETSIIQPASVYALTKYYQEELLKITCISQKLSFTSLRFQNVYGPGQSLNNPYTGIISIFSNRLRENKEVYIFEDGHESRDFVFIDDVCRALEFSINNEKNLTLNVGSGVNTTVIKLAELLKKLMNSSSKLTITGQYRLGDIRHNFADLNKINRELGFNPNMFIEEGLTKFVEWSSLQSVKNDFYENSLTELKQKGLLK